MRNQGIGSWPARRARRTPDKLAVVHGEDRLTYAELARCTNQLAHALRELGVRRGDRVAFLGPNSTEFLESLFAAGQLGAIFVPLNTRLAVPELRHCLVDSGSDVLIVAEQAAADDLTGIVQHRIVIADGGWQWLLADRSTEPIDELVQHDDPCMIMYTSGTTGAPKGAVLSHGNIIWNSLNVLVDLDLTGNEVTLVVAPMFHTAGLNMTCLPTILKGGTVVIEAAFDTDRVLQLIARLRITYMFGVPTMYAAMAAGAAWERTDLSSLRHLNCGGAPVPPALIRTYHDRGLSFSQGYGMTEASPGILYLSRELSTRKAGTAGVPHFFTDVRVVTPDGSDAAPGVNGEIVVSGPNVMEAYWERPDDTDAAFSGAGWLHTGDAGVVDTDGYVSIVDRIKDVIISGGENIYPAEVEAALHEHPAVAACAVVGVPDEKWGEVGRAVVALADGESTDEAALLGFLTTRLARYKVPKSVVFVGELPRNATGKVLRKQVRARHGHPEQEGDNP